MFAAPFLLNQSDYRPRGRSPLSEEKEDEMEDVVEEPVPRTSQATGSGRVPEPEWKPRRLMSDEEKKRQNYEGRQAKKEKKAAWKTASQGASPQKGKSKGKPGGKGKKSGKPPPHRGGQVRQLERFGWIRAVGGEVELDQGDDGVAPEAAEVGEPSEAG